MPIDPTLIHVVNGDTVTAESINNINTKVSEYLNGGIDSTDIEGDDDWVDRQHIIRPEFYGAPAPRVLLTSSDVHYREAGAQQDISIFHFMMGSAQWLAIPGMSASITINQSESRTESAPVRCIIRAQWRTTEHYGGTTSISSSQRLEDRASSLCAFFALFIDGQRVVGTTRRLFASGNRNKKGRCDLASKNHSILYSARDLLPGVHDIGVRIYTVTGSNNSWQRIQIKQRVLNIETEYL
jgi:hypothetical protein